MAYNHGHISERGILEADCRILAKRDFVLAYARNGHISRGMRVEIEYALAIKKSIFIFRKWSELTPMFFSHFLDILPVVIESGLWTFESPRGMGNLNLVAKNYLTEIE